MSRFLAPIHTWLFNKVKLSQDLEEHIVRLHEDKYKKDALKIQEEAVTLYGKYLVNKPLEELIDVDNIHGWLQERIKEVESRTAYIVTKYKEIYGEDSVELTKNAYIQQATECVKNESNKIDTPENVYVSLNNYILAGMPCDRASSVIEKNEEYIKYQENKDIHKSNYELGKGDLKYLYNLRELWIKSFVENLGIRYAYESEVSGSISDNKIIKL